VNAPRRRTPAALAEAPSPSPLAEAPQTIVAGQPAQAPVIVTRRRLRPLTARERILAMREEVLRRYGTTPLEFLLSEMVNEDNPKAVRIRAAVDAAPFCHPKLSSIDVGTSEGEAGGRLDVRLVSFTLDREEMDQLEGSMAGDAPQLEQTK
jgi:hypothetical protein